MNTLTFARQKRHHLKVTSGCLTCRSRHVKCDEQRPRCRKCTKSDRPCRGLGYGDDFDSKYSTRWVQQKSSKDSRASTCSAIVTRSSPSIKSQYDVASSQSLSATKLQNGHIDPFDSLCVPNPTSEAFNLIDHFALKIWAVYGSNGERDIQSLKQDAMMNAFTDQTSFFTSIYAAASHQAFLRSNYEANTGPDSKHLVLKQNAISALMEASKSALEEHEVSDEFLRAVLAMTSHSLGDLVKKTRIAAIQLRKPQIPIPSAEFYDALELAPEHRNILFILLEQKGGLQAVKNIHLRTAIIRYGIYVFYRTLQPPRFERIQPLESLPLLVQHNRSLSERPDLIRLTRGLCALFRSTDSDPTIRNLSKIIQAIAILTREQHLILLSEHRKSIPNIHDLLNREEQAKGQNIHDPAAHAARKTKLTWSRSMVMWELLSLPDRSEDIYSSAHPAIEVLAYELCRITCFMYYQMWIWVLANPKINMARKLLLKMLPLLAASLSPSIETGEALYQVHPQFFLWVVTLTVVMAYEDYEQTADSNMAKSILPYLRRLPVKPTPDAWSDVSSLLEEFLWSTADCDPLGKDAWTFACSLPHEIGS